MKRYVPALLALAVALVPLSPAVARSQPDNAHLAYELALAQRDQQDLQQARPALRDLVDLTRRLKLHSLTPISPYATTAAPVYDVGHVEAFWIPQVTSGYYKATATLLYKTAHAYWYVQDGTGIARDRLLAAVRASARDFEDHIYPTDRATFGHEWATGPDHDPRISVLCYTSGLAGYYSAEDLYPRSVNAFSNQRKLFSVNIVDFPLGTPQFASTLAHEFQHMIHWYRHERDDTWINEGSSVLAQVLNGYGVDGMDQSFAAAPGTQLDNFCYGAPNCDDNLAYSYYGGSFLWMLYFYQQYGGAKAMRALLDDGSLSGTALFDDVLARLGSRDDARAMFRKWAIANLVDNPAIDGGIYGYRAVYPGCCVHASLTATTQSYPYTRHAAVNQFATDYIQLKPAGASTLHLRFAGDPTVRIVANAPVQGHAEWWSNRGDEMDSTLTRAVDLGKVSHATLQFDTWYSIERDFDYGYVEVSADGGRTWHTLRGRATTNSDPNGANYGNGYTGDSTAVPGNRGGWVHESIDLSAYAGKHILLRFEHITDDAFNLSGMTLDNVRIPEIGFADAPGASGWQSRGWVRISNLLPTHWLVQLVLYTTHGVQVRQVPLALDAGGQAVISGLGRDVQSVVVAVSPTAVQTTIPSSYTLSVTP